MEKYACFTRLTDKYLHGNLEELSVNYDDDTTLRVSISYEYNNYYTLNYEVEVDVEDRCVRFLGHRSLNGLNKIDLNREEAFDKAVSEYFFS